MESWKIALSAIVPLFAALALIAWKGVQSGEKVWFTLAKRWGESQEFRDLIGRIVDASETESMYKFKETTDTIVAKHDDLDRAHRPAFRHERANTDQAFVSQHEIIADLRRRIEALEGRRSGDKS